MFTLPSSFSEDTKAMSDAYDVFLSYSRKDVELMRKLHDLLEHQEIDGNPIVVFRDERDLGIGEHVDVALPAAHRRSASVVVLWSDDSVASKWVYNEAISAVFGEKYLPLLEGDFNPAGLDASLRPINAARLAAILVDPQPLVEEIRRLKNRGAPAVRVMNKMPASGSEHLIGRGVELLALNEAWGSGKTRIFVLDAMGGIGKTALINRFLEGVAGDNWGDAEHVYCWSFYSQGTDDKRRGDADGFFAETLEWFGYRGDEIKSPTRRGETLAELNNQRRTLLVLDGLEPLQYPENTPGIEGKLKDDGLAAMFKRLSLQMNGMVIVTTRIPLPELKGRASPAIEKVTLNQLTTRHGVLLLQILGVKASLNALTPKAQETELAFAVTWLQGHALSLNLLGTYARVMTGGILPTEEEIKRALVDPVVSKASYFMMRRYEIMFEDRAGESKHPEEASAASRQLALLYLIGLFDRPADRHALDVLLDYPITGLTDSLTSLRRTEWAFAVEALRNLKLLLPETTPGEIDAHPLVREYFGARLRVKKPEEFRAANIRLYEHYRLKGLPEEFHDTLRYGLLALSGALNEQTSKIVGLLLNNEFPVDQQYLVPPILHDVAPERLLALRDEHNDETISAALEKALPDSVKAMEPLFAAIAHGCAAGAHNRALREIYLTRVTRGDAWFLTKKLGAFGADLSTLAHFFLEPFTLPSPNLDLRDQTLILSEAAYRLRSLGRIAEAEAPMTEVLRRGLEDKNFHHSTVYAVNLSEVQLATGQIKAAIGTSQAAVTYADRMNNDNPRAEFWRFDTRVLYASALHQAGQLAIAATLFENAERRQAQLRRESPLLHSLRGARYCDLLLSCGDASEVKRRASETIKIAQDNNWLLDIALDTLSLGYAALVLDNWSEARTRLDAAIDALHAAGTTHHVPRGYLARAAFYRVIGDLALAAQDLDDAADIADRSGLKLHQCDIALERARHALTQLPLPTPNEAVLKRQNTGAASPAIDAAAPSSLEQREVKDSTSVDYPVNTATRCADKASLLIEETGYRRRLPDLALVRARIALIMGDRITAKLNLAEVRHWINEGWRIHVLEFEELSASLSQEVVSTSADSEG
jgi:tetratricopeptide (TPR) repeat protein